MERAALRHLAKELTRCTEIHRVLDNLKCDRKARIRRRLTRGRLAPTAAPRDGSVSESVAVKGVSVGDLTIVSITAYGAHARNRVESAPRGRGERVKCDVMEK